MREEMVLSNVKLIYHVLKQMHLYDKCDEYFDVGMIGLVKGVKTYNYDSGVKVSTYLCKCIRNEILLEIRKGKRNKTIPRDIIYSIDANISDELTYRDIIPDDVDIEKDFITIETNNMLYELVSKLRPKEQYIINHSFGLGDYEKMRNNDIAIKLNITPNHVARTKRIAISKLKKYIGAINLNSSGSGI